MKLGELICGKNVRLRYDQLALTSRTARAASRVFVPGLNHVSAFASNDDGHDCTLPMALWWAPFCDFDLSPDYRYSPSARPLSRNPAGRFLDRLARVGRERTGVPTTDPGRSYHLACSALNSVLMTTGNVVSGRFDGRSRMKR
jgi:hypothetical protein